MKTLMKTALALLGATALYEGWRSLRTEVPKPTEQENVTRVDYLSGDYQQQLEQREQQLDRERTRGKWYMVAGATLLAGGLSVLMDTMLEKASEPSSNSGSDESNPDSDEPTAAANENPVTKARS